MDQLYYVHLNEKYLEIIKQPISKGNIVLKINSMFI